MARKISNLILAVISALILLFIAIAFYDAFTREPVNREIQLSSSSSVTLSSSDNAQQSGTSTPADKPQNTEGTQTVPSHATTDTSIVPSDSTTQSAYDSTTDEPSDTTNSETAS